MGFKFRYQSLLSYREHLKEKAEIEFGSAQRRLQKGRQDLEVYEARLHKARISLEKGLMSRMTSGEMGAYSDYLNGMKRKIAAQKQEVARREKSVAEKRKKLLERTKEYRIIEKLMEKDHQTWTNQLSLLEQKKVDEMSVTRHGKNYR
jgi:flagellar FliJ protein